jgi:hypothetical protein
LIEIGSGRFAVDVPVTSEEAVGVLPGAVLEMTVVPPNLISATCLDGFTDTAPPVSLAKLAQLTRETIYAASPGQLGGLRRFIRQMLPQVLRVSATGPGDAEMLRGTANALGLTVPAADVFVAGQHAFREESQLVWLDYDSIGGTFAGQWRPIQTPLLLRGIYWDGNPGQAVVPTVWGRSTDEAKAPLLTAAGSGLDEYFITLPMPLADDTSELISVSQTGSAWGAWFNVLYLSDPDVAVARSLLCSDDNKPQGVDVLVRPPVVVEIESLNISYRRRAGQSLRLTAARDEIRAHINSCGWPDRMTPAPWIDSMYYAGATVVNITVAATVRWTVAGRWLRSTVPLPTVNLAAATAGFFEPPAVVPDTATPDGLTPALVDAATKAACGWRNLAWYVEDRNISFTELS